MEGSRTVLWCVPRSASTALTKCLSAGVGGGEDGMEVWFESFCFCYILKRRAETLLGRSLPEVYEGNEELFQEAANGLGDFLPGRFDLEKLSYGTIGHMLESATCNHIFLKDMAYALTPAQFKHIPRGFRHTFLIRHPLRVFHSNRKAMSTHISTGGVANDNHVFAEDDADFDLVRDDPLMTPGLLFKDIYDIWQYVRTNIDPTPIILDADDLLSNPSDVLPKYCRAIGVPYQESMLRWDGSKEVTKSWKTPLLPGYDLCSTFPAFFDRAMNSTGFHPPSKMPNYVTSDVMKSTQEVIKFYSEMYDARVTA